MKPPKYRYEDYDINDDVNGVCCDGRHLTQLEAVAEAAWRLYHHIDSLPHHKRQGLWGADAWGDLDKALNELYESDEL